MGALLKLCSLLETGGFRPFLVAGTLLGLVRSGSLLAHDRDIDIGLHSARPGDRYVGLTVNGIAADIFVFDQTPSGMVCGFSNLPGDIQWRHTPFQLHNTRLARGMFCIPTPTETYLSECYGPGWRKPDPDFASAISSPALHNTSPYAIAYLALARARTCLLAGNATKAAALLQQLPRIDLPQPGSVAREAMAHTIPAIKRQT